jgi:hypothetical protein
VHTKADGVVVARREVRIVSVKAFDAAGRAPYPAARSMTRVRRNRCVALARVSVVGLFDGVGEIRVRFDRFVGFTYATTRFDPRDSAVRQ